MTKKRFKELHKKGALKLLAIPFGTRTFSLSQNNNNPLPVLIQFLEENILEIQKDNKKFLLNTTNYVIDGKQFSLKQYGDYIIILEDVRKANIPNIQFDMVTYLNT